MFVSWALGSIAVFGDGNGFLIITTNIIAAVVGHIMEMKTATFPYVIQNVYRDKECVQAQTFANAMQATMDPRVVALKLVHIQVHAILEIAMELKGVSVNLALVELIAYKCQTIPLFLL